MGHILQDENNGEFYKNSGNYREIFFSVETGSGLSPKGLAAILD